jgi:hypothetical protein
MNPERRAFVAFLSAVLATRTIPAKAQQATRVRTVGVLMGLANDEDTQARTRSSSKASQKRAGSSVKTSASSIASPEAMLSAC